MVRRALATLLVSTLALAAEPLASAPAAPAPATPKPSASPSTASVPSGPPSVERLVQLVADDVRALRPEPPVALHLSGSSAELQRAFGTMLASRLAASELGPVVLDAPSPEAAENQARERGARSLVRLTISVQEGQLSARGDVLGTWINFWSGRTPSRPVTPAAALAQAVDADAGTLSLAALSPVLAPSSSSTTTVMTGPRQMRLMGAALVKLDQVPAALATGDLDGDGKDEVAVLTERAVSVFAADGRLIARRELESLPLSSAPPREPFGVISVIPQPARLAAWSARYAHGEVLTLDAAKGTLRPLGPLDTTPLGATERGTFTSGQTTFTSEVRLSEGRILTVPAPFTTASIVTPRMLFVHLDGSASLYSRPTAPPLRIQGLGAGSALGDLDGDGTPELITTSPQLFPSPDVVRVYPLTGDDPTTHGMLWQTVLPPGRAFQVVTADLDRDNQREVLVGLWHSDGTGEVFLMRQGAP
ncbi:FG-GAP repeat protein [Hyalangium minutum]|uniref:FG-GAP repeat protein n=1 Tax=Hyalangium minutum TaxID=394096 RepID=A0A085WXE3_9BACT|nr:VCBS repeat-containing protein [Hyalangium minutum]KFE72356.1 FG-GAP repeat protein [Hyalangium minutum]